MMRLIIVTCLLVGFVIPAFAKSTYRVTDIQPAPGGAVLNVTYANDWGNPQSTKQNEAVKFWIYPNGNQEQLINAGWSSGAPYVKPGAVCVGDCQWPGTGNTKIKLDYKALGLKAGQPILTGVTWDVSGHVHGDICGGRLAGGPWTLPKQPTAAKKNSLMRRRGTGRLGVGFARPGGRSFWSASRRIGASFARRPLRR